jgi:hypothetical protein
MDFSVFDKPDYYPPSVEVAEKPTPTGIPVYDNRFFVTGDWEPLSWLTLGSTISAGWVENDDHVSGKQAFSTEFALYAKIRFY